MGGYLSKGRVVVVDVGGGNQLRIILQHRIDCVCMCVVRRGGQVLEFFNSKLDFHCHGSENRL